MREVRDLILTDGGLEKHFKITQMSALKQERWINRVITLFVSTNAKDMASVQAILGSGKAENIMALLSGIEYDKIEPLYNELLECVSHVPDTSNPGFMQPLTIHNVEAIVSDVQTLYKLRLESLKVNFGFFLNALLPQKQKSTESSTVTIRKPTKM